MWFSLQLSFPKGTRLKVIPALEREHATCYINLRTDGATEAALGLDPLSTDGRDDADQLWSSGEYRQEAAGARWRKLSPQLSGGDRACLLQKPVRGCHDEHVLGETSWQWWCSVDCH